MKHKENKKYIISSMSSGNKFQFAGFSLIELVVIILLLGILAVVALPRLVSISNFSSYTLRDEFIGELRKAQIMAMNNTDRCYRVSVESDGYQIKHYGSRTTTGICQGSILRTDAKQEYNSGSSVSFISTGASTFNLDFDREGKIIPTCSGNCVRINAENTLNIAIEAQGYIHAS